MRECTGAGRAFSELARQRSAPDIFNPLETRARARAQALARAPDTYRPQQNRQPAPDTSNRQETKARPPDTFRAQHRPQTSSRCLVSSFLFVNDMTCWLWLAGMGSLTQDQRQNFPLQRINTADKLAGSNGMTRAQKTLSIHGMPSIAVPTTQPPNRSSIGGGAGAAGGELTLLSIIKLSKL